MVPPRLAAAFSAIGAFASSITPGKIFVPIRAATYSAATLIGAAVAHKRVKAAWVPTSDSHLEQAETKMFEHLKTPIRHLMVTTGDNTIHTVIADAHDGQREKPVLVLVHGFGGGVGLWANNFDDLAEHYTVYAIDVLGFGRSSRPAFRGKTAADASAFFVDSLEEWRKAVGLKKSFVLLGHSLGGFIATKYALQHPDLVQHLLLAAPFGVAKQPIVAVNPSSLPLRVKLLRYFAERSSPQALVRIAGPWGPTLMTRMRGAYDNARYGFTDNRVSDYVYHLTAGPGSAEYAFMALQDGIGFAKEPLYDHMSALTMPVGFIYGDRDFITFTTAVALQPSLRVPSEIVVIEGAAHHAYATHPEEFTSAIARCMRVGAAAQA